MEARRGRDSRSEARCEARERGPRGRPLLKLLEPHTLGRAQYADILNENDRSWTNIDQLRTGLRHVAKVSEGSDTL